MCFFLIYLVDLHIYIFLAGIWRLNVSAAIKICAATAVGWYPWISTSRPTIFLLQRNVRVEITYAFAWVKEHPLMAPLVAKVFKCWWRLFLHAVLQQCCSFGLRFYLQVGAWSGWRERRRNAGEQPPVSRFIYNGSLDDRWKTGSMNFV